eukprot:1321387-Pyramimonas_sp.AAC.1
MQFYEHAPYRLLVNSAKDSNYPLSNLLLSNSSLNSAPGRGIAAGSTTATHGAQLALHPTMGECAAEMSDNDVASSRVGDLARRVRGADLV